MIFYFFYVFIVLVRESRLDDDPEIFLAGEHVANDVRPLVPLDRQIGDVQRIDKALAIVQGECELMQRPFLVA